MRGVMHVLSLARHREVGEVVERMGYISEGYADGTVKNAWPG